MCSTNERYMEKMKKWNQIYEWSKKVRTYFDRDCSASLVDEEDPVVRRVVKRLSDPEYLQKRGLEQKRFDAESAFRKLRRKNRGRMMIRVGSVAAVFALILGGVVLYKGHFSQEKKVRN